jgi:hypothetical protein
MRSGLMRSALGLILAASVVALLALSLEQRAGAHSASRVIDRTVVCAAALSGGIYEIDARAQAGAGRRGSTWEKPAIAMFTTGGTGSAAQALDNALVWGIAGNPTRDATVIPDPFPGFTYPIRAWGTLAMTRRCRVSRTRPALSARGLRGGPVDGLGESFDCPSPRRVLLRIRAELTTSASLGTRRGYLGTTTPLRDARLVVATPAGKRLAYAEVLGSGKARLFTASSCIPD